MRDKGKGNRSKKASNKNSVDIKDSHKNLEPLIQLPIDVALSEALVAFIKLSAEQQDLLIEENRDLEGMEKESVEEEIDSDFPEVTLEIVTSEGFEEAIEIELEKEEIKRDDLRKALTKKQRKILAQLEQVIKIDKDPNKLDAQFTKYPTLDLVAALDIGIKETWMKRNYLETLAINILYSSSRNCMSINSFWQNMAKFLKSDKEKEIGIIVLKTVLENLYLNLEKLIEDAENVDASWQNVFRAKHKSLLKGSRNLFPDTESHLNFMEDYPAVPYHYRTDLAMTEFKNLAEGCEVSLDVLKACCKDFNKIPHEEKRSEWGIFWANQKKLIIEGLIAKMTLDSTFLPKIAENTILATVNQSSVLSTFFTMICEEEKIYSQAAHKKMLDESLPLIEQRMQAAQAMKEGLQPAGRKNEEAKNKRSALRHALGYTKNALDAAKKCLDKFNKKHPIHPSVKPANTSNLSLLVSHSLLAPPNSEQERKRKGNAEVYERDEKEVCDSLKKMKH